MPPVADGGLAQASAFSERMIAASSRSAGAGALSKMLSTPGVWVFSPAASMAVRKAAR